MAAVVVHVKKSRFGKVKLTFRPPDLRSRSSDTNYYVYCNKTSQVLRVWYMPSVKGWCAEIQDRDANRITTFGSNMLWGEHFDTAKAAWNFVAQKAWH